MISKKPYISVIIPTYNRARFIIKAIDSVLNQKNCQWPFEIIIVDDGSTDNTESILKPYKNKIRYFKIPHSGLPAVARNYGIKKARGELIAFQDSDDLWVPNKLASQIPVFDDRSVILSYGNAELSTNTDKRSKQTVIPQGSGKSGFIFKELIDTNFISTLTVMARKDSIVDAGGFNESPSLRGVEDYELWLRLSAHGQFIFVDKPLALHRRHAENISHTIDYQNNEHILSVYREILKTNVTKEQKSLVRHAIHHLLNSRQNRLSGIKYITNKVQIFTNKARLN
ncbi:MAG: glycosyltransferase [Candidatus Saccharimonadales bacterium]